VSQSWMEGDKVNTTKGGGENRRVGDSQDRLVVVHVGVKQGLDHSVGEFGVLGTVDCILGLHFGSIVFSILGIGTAEQSTIGNCQKQKKNERRQQEERNTSGASASWRISSGGQVCRGHRAIEGSSSNPGK